MTGSKTYACVKCGGGSYDSQEIRTTGKYSRFFDMQNKKFIALSCTQCGYTEMYRADGRGVSNFLDMISS